MDLVAAWASVDTLRQEVAYRRQRVARCRDAYARFPTRAADRALSSAENVLELVLVELENEEARHLGHVVPEPVAEARGEEVVEGLRLP